MSYVDGFVVPVPRARLDDYLAMSRRCGADRDAINDKVMKDPRLAEDMKPENMPFDGKRMIYGGFEPRVML